jgi:hypothetical protein
MGFTEEADIDGGGGGREGEDEDGGEHRGWWCGLDEKGLARELW